MVWGVGYTTLTTDAVSPRSGQTVLKHCQPSHRDAVSATTSIVVGTPTIFYGDTTMKYSEGV